MLEKWPLGLGFSKDSKSNSMIPVLDPDNGLFSGGKWGSFFAGRKEKVLTRRENQEE